MAFLPQNKLEESLVKAASDPAHRAQFYRDFMEADVFIVAVGPVPETAGYHTMEKDTQVKIQNIEWKGQTYIPIFSSLQRLQSALREPSPYMALKAADFLNLTKGANIILNPGLEYGKKFPKEEVACMLDGSIWRPVENYVTTQEQKVLIGQPANYPTQLVAALCRVFEKLPDVECAYVAHFFNPARDKKAHTLIAIRVSQNWDAVMADTGIVIREVPTPDPPTDVLRLSGAGGIHDYITKQCKPFM